MVNNLACKPPIKNPVNSHLNYVLEINGYTYMKALGVGGFADVFQYEQNFPKRNVAIKISRSNYFDLVARRQFLNEAAVLAQLSSHPYIINVYDSGLTQSGHLFISMEVATMSLRNLIEQKYLSTSEIINTFIKIGTALEHAHASGVMHCDIKPSNILFNNFGQPLLADFGIASTMGNSTYPTAFSPKYCAPEILQMRSSNTVASEIYSLTAALRACYSDMPTNSELKKFFEMNLSHNPAKRQQSVADFTRQLAILTGNEQLLDLINPNLAIKQTANRMRSYQPINTTDKLENVVYMQSPKSESRKCSRNQHRKQIESKLVDKNLNRFKASLAVGLTSVVLIMITISAALNL
jgi:serine/threonine protein kinase